MPTRFCDIKPTTHLSFDESSLSSDEQSNKRDCEPTHAKYSNSLFTLDMTSQREVLVLVFSVILFNCLMQFALLWCSTKIPSESILDEPCNSGAVCIRICCDRVGEAECKKSFENVTDFVKNVTNPEMLFGEAVCLSNKYKHHHNISFQEVFC